LKLTGSSRKILNLTQTAPTSGTLTLRMDNLMKMAYGGNSSTLNQHVDFDTWTRSEKLESSPAEKPKNPDPAAVPPAKKE
jgi:hypothetical protein